MVYCRIFSDFLPENTKGPDVRHVGHCGQKCMLHGNSLQHEIFFGLSEILNFAKIQLKFNY